MDEGTGTDNSMIYPDTQPVDIQFHGTLSYAEKLMLKKSRRHQLGPVSSEGSQSSGLSDYHLSDIEVLNQHALGKKLHKRLVYLQWKMFFLLHYNSVPCGTECYLGPPQAVTANTRKMGLILA